MIIALHYPFYKAIILMLEFIVIIEVVKMISEFIKKKRLRMRYVIDVFIIFLTREVIILTTHPDKDHQEILFLLLVIFVFFLFRILAVQFSPAHSKRKKSQTKF
ncbi:phosphate-starvation-inducible PsiE family protein [Sulfurovum sp. XTW-4]|uniref:Phosphate-starvation-inducible PsiE family protein n=1 Tax=Sulfurovum xiamenensis TaxID=3019066 RepID=A0ABT7QQ18_9BACT|nr:phosphate-starvation-inducible PsiE family protein [Sulfurovum xiamenensis]MDM5263181.1 phosphate-starvation-inducible PsiE family protein [Sulfurovum xiamenensis]